MAKNKKDFAKETKQLLDSLISQSKEDGYIQESKIIDKFDNNVISVLIGYNISIII